MDKKAKRQRRIKHTSKKLFGTSDMPRASVYRSNKHISAQIVNDETHSTLIAYSDAKLKGKLKPIDKATEVGMELGKMALSNGIKKVVFDRRGYKYHGRVKALADGMRKAGLQF